MFSATTTTAFATLPALNSTRLHTPFSSNLRCTRRYQQSKMSVEVNVERRAAYIQRVREQLTINTAESADALWSLMQIEARDVASEEPFLASFLYSTVLNHSTLPQALAYHLANKLATKTMTATQLLTVFNQVLSDNHYLRAAIRSDLLAIMERDAACLRLTDAMLNYKGFHALQAYRISNALWHSGRKQLAMFVQSQVNRQLQVDIHPAATIGTACFIDHATGVVIGETVVIGDNCSLMHHVTLGGSGTNQGTRRHPTIGHNVSIGAGATVVGDVRIGDNALIGAASFVLENVPDHATAVGVPARVLPRSQPKQPPEPSVRRNKTPVQSNTTAKLVAAI